MKTVVARSHDQSHLKIREFLSIMYVGIGIKLRRKWFISQGSGSFQRAGAPIAIVCSSVSLWESAALLTLGANSMNDWGGVKIVILYSRTYMILIFVYYVIYARNQQKYVPHMK